MDGKSVAVALIETLPGLLWSAFILYLAYIFRNTISVLAKAIKIRLEKGEPIKFWILELERFATQSEQDRVRESSKIRTVEDASRQSEIEALKTVARNLMLVDTSYKRVNNLGPYEWDIVFYLVTHWGDLAVVERVEYAFDKGWGNTVFISEDRAHGFAMKVGLYGSILCTAHIYFTDKEKTSLARYALVEPPSQGAVPHSHT